MKKIGFALLLFSILSATAQEEITRQTSDFYEIKVFDEISAELIRSEENKIVISGENTDEVTVLNKNGKLKIRMNITELFNGHRTFVKIYHTNDIYVIDANENTLITSADNIKQVDLELRAQEGGEINLNADVQKLKVKAVTGGKIEVTGTAKKSGYSRKYRRPVRSRFLDNRANHRQCQCRWKSLHKRIGIRRSQS